MAVGFARKTGALNRNQLEHSIKRNFGGFDPDEFSPMELFLEDCHQIFKALPASRDGEPATDSIGLIKASLFGASHRLEKLYFLIV